MPDSSSMPLWPGWETVRVIGRGSFGVVYEISRDYYGIRESAALKVISIPQYESEVDELFGSGYSSQSITEHFNGLKRDILKEYQLMTGLKGYTNVVSSDDIRTVQKDSGIGWDIYIKMELLTPLTKHLGSEIPEEQVIRIGRDKIGRAHV